MKALTLTCPWGPAIAHWDKRVENRTWSPPESLIGQRLAIHAGKSPLVPVEASPRAPAGWKWLSGAAREETQDAIAFARRAGAPTGEITPAWLHERSSAILAVATVQGWATNTLQHRHPSMNETDAIRLVLNSPWFVGGDAYGWVLADVIALPEPVSCKGAQGLWPLPADVEAQVREQLARAGGAT